MFCENIPRNRQENSKNRKENRKENKENRSLILQILPLVANFCLRFLDFPVEIKRSPEQGFLVQISIAKLPEILSKINKIELEKPNLKKLLLLLNSDNLRELKLINSPASPYHPGYIVCKINNLPKFLQQINLDLKPSRLFAFLFQLFKLRKTNISWQESSQEKKFLSRFQKIGFHLDKIGENRESKYKVRISIPNYFAKLVEVLRILARQNLDLLEYKEQLFLLIQYLSLVLGNKDLKVQVQTLDLELELNPNLLKIDLSSFLSLWFQTIGTEKKQLQTSANLLDLALSIIGKQNLKRGVQTYLGNSLGNYLQKFAQSVLNPFGKSVNFPLARQCRSGQCFLDFVRQFYPQNPLLQALEVLSLEELENLLEVILACNLLYFSTETKS